jgi:Ca-activated chloride channel family protein
MTHARMPALALTTVAIATLMGSIATSRAQRPTFSSAVERVLVDVLVTRGGRPVPGLVAADFELLDNGVPQSVALVSYDRLPLNVLMALDRSGSVGPRFEQVRRAVERLLDQLKPDDRAAAILFNDTVASGSALTDDLAQVRRVVREVVPSGGTALVDAVYAGVVVGETHVGRTLLIVFTDGVDTSSFLDRRKVVAIGTRTDVVLYTVSIGPAAERAFLRDLVTSTGGRMIELASPQRVGETFVQILSEFRQRYLLTYTPRGVSGPGWHRIEVGVKRKGFSVKARPGYFAAP